MLPPSDNEALHTVRRDFALEVVQRLTDAGFEALWAGGCVRDALLGQMPKDYDVATSATPDEVIRLFGRKRTVPVGVSFGVVMVLSRRRDAGQIEVATFRTDGLYSDGRRPDSVTFCSAEEDARRRDFTINGMFFDPLKDQLIDYVGGEQDLANRIVRAIGQADARIEEDKLRMLRAVRFAATLGFQIDPDTEQSVRDRHQSLVAVSIERVAAEVQRMLAHPHRARAVELLDSTGLLDVIFPVPHQLVDNRTWYEQWNLPIELATLSEMQVPRFEHALLLLMLRGELARENARQILRYESRRLKLANSVRDCLCWLQSAIPLMNNIAEQPLHVRKPLLAHKDRELVLDLSRARDIARGGAPDGYEFCRSYLQSVPAEILDPPPLVSGHDLMHAGVPAGPAIRRILDTLRREQLDELLNDREDALRRLTALADAPPTET